MKTTKDKQDVNSDINVKCMWTWRHIFPVCNLQDQLQGYGSLVPFSNSYYNTINHFEQKKATPHCEIQDKLIAKKPH